MEHSTMDHNANAAADHEPPPFTMRNRRMTIYQSRPGRPRWVLHMQAVFWRVLMGLGMFFHRLAPPRPPKPDFVKVIPAVLSGQPGSIPMNFYVPKDYETQQRLWADRSQPGQDLQDDGEAADKGKNKRMSVVSTVSQSIRRRSTAVRKWGGYPVIINFHGGGFTLGSALDDARWCGTAVDECHAVVVSVDYRLAPEHPFPVAVEDGVDAVVYIHEHAEELGIDREKIALSGFSSGANMCFTVPLRLYDEIAGFPRGDDINFSHDRPDTTQTAETTVADTTATPAVPPSTSTGPPPPTAASLETDAYSTTSTAVAPNNSRVHLLEPKDSSPLPAAPPSQPTKSSTFATTTEADPDPSIPPISIRCIIPWYPPVDYTRTREQRRATCVRADQELPALFTDLFDESYLHPPHTLALDSPYLSPAVAPAALLRAALPHEIILHTCEWDMLMQEAALFRDRLVAPDIAKAVSYAMIPGVPHGWDKAPNPWKPTPGVREHYLRACKEIRRVMGPPEKGGRPLLEREVTAGPSAAARGSIALVR